MVANSGLKSTMVYPSNKTSMNCYYLRDRGNRGAIPGGWDCVALMESQPKATGLREGGVEFWWQPVICCEGSAGN